MQFMSKKTDNTKEKFRHSRLLSGVAKNSLNHSLTVFLVKKN
jgi:hypothetical protein